MTARARRPARRRQLLGGASAGRPPLLHHVRGRDRVLAAPRTVLLTATLTSRSARTLQTLFDGPGSFGVVSAAQLRPEIDYWVAAASGPDEREQHVLEALLHLPRPAILYVTQVHDARSWYARLSDLGFERLRCIHGETPSDARAETVKAWGEGSVDLVVGTSAFGLGIDNAEVRAVVHACVPETLALPCHVHS